MYEYVNFVRGSIKLMKLKYKTIAVLMLSVTGQCKSVCCKMCKTKCMIRILMMLLASVKTSD
jgi:hypothetical protein